MHSAEPRARLCCCLLCPACLGRVKHHRQAASSMFPCFTGSSCSFSLATFKLSKQSGHIPTQPARQCHHHVLLLKKRIPNTSKAPKQKGLSGGHPLGRPYRTVSDPEHEASVLHLQPCQVLTLLVFGKNKRGFTTSPAQDFGDSPYSTFATEPGPMPTLQGLRKR